MLRPELLHLTRTGVPNLSPQSRLMPATTQRIPDTPFDVSAGAPALRPATPSDLPAIERLLVESALPLAGVAECLADCPGAFTVAEAGGALVGVAGLELRGETALLRSVAVAPDWRSRRLGRALVTRVVADAEARALRVLYLLTTTAEHYFPSFGFERVERGAVPPSIAETLEFRSACPASAVAMMRPLAP